MLDIQNTIDMKIKDKFRKLIEYDPDRELVGNAKDEMDELRREMKKANPSPEKISNLLCGTKYNKAI